MGMSEHQHSHSHGAEPMSMPVVFHTAMSTALFSEAWTTHTSSQYSATCLALVVFTVILRVLLAFKPRLEATIWSLEKHPEGRSVVGRDYEDIGVGKEDQAEEISLPGRSHKNAGLRGLMREVQVRLGRAIYEVLIALLGYLLMLAVMSMNVGYFLSVLFGVFLGTVGLGGIASDSTFDHCS